MLSRHYYGFSFIQFEFSGESSPKVAAKGFPLLPISDAKLVPKFAAAPAGHGRERNVIIRAGRAWVEKAMFLESAPIGGKEFLQRGGAGFFRANVEIKIQVKLQAVV